MTVRTGTRPDATPATALPEPVPDAPPEPVPDVRREPAPRDGTPREDPYRARIREAVDGGSRFAGLHVGADGRTVRTVLRTPAGRWTVVGTPVRDGAVPTIVDLVPAAQWDEREARDLHAVDFAGHRPLRPLLRRGATGEWTVPVRGPDAYQIAVGPIHAGVIESGHFRFHVVGDEILHVDAQLFHKHRGLERAAEGLDPDGGLRYAGRACAACSVANTLAYAHAWEEALGLAGGEELARARTVLLELERVWNHLNDIAAVCAGVGLAVGNARFAALTERARRLNARLCGHRFLAGTVRVGRSGTDLGAGAVRSAREELADLRVHAERGWRELLFNASFQDRMASTGVLDRDAALALGTVGPAARACGIPTDARVACDRLLYGDFPVPVPERGTGDARSRVEQRVLELRQSFAILDELLGRPLAPSAAEPAGPGADLGVGQVESSRGATTCVVERDGRTLRRWRLRTASFANWPAVARAASGDVLPDFPLINKSFELCYACVDR